MNKQSFSSITFNDQSMSKNLLRKQYIHIQNAHSHTLDLKNFSRKINYILVSDTTNNYFNNFTNVRDTNGFKRSSSCFLSHLSGLVVHIYNTGKMLVKRILDAYIFTLVWLIYNTSFPALAQEHFYIFVVSAWNGKILRIYFIGWYLYGIILSFDHTVDIEMALRPDAKKISTCNL